MATLEWTGTSADWTASANWGGSAPASGDTLRLMSGTQQATTNVNQPTWNSNTIYVGPDYAGYLGTAAAPIVLGTGATVIVNAPMMKGFAFSCTSATLIAIVNTARSLDSFYLVAGTITDFAISGSASARIGGGTLGNLKALGASARLAIVGGAVATARCSGGAVVESDIVPVNLYLSDSRWTQQSSTSGTATMIEVNGSQSVLSLDLAKSLVVTQLRGAGGLIDGRRARLVTLTASEFHAGCIAKLDPGRSGVFTFSANPINWGARLTVPPGTTVDQKIGEEFGVGGGGGGAGL